MKFPRFCIRCAVCNAMKNFCHCPPGYAHSTSVDAAPCECPDKVEDTQQPSQTIREKFEAFCDEHPDHHDCKMFDD